MSDYYNEYGETWLQFEQYNRSRRDDDSRTQRLSLAIDTQTLSLIGSHEALAREGYEVQRQLSREALDAGHRDTERLASEMSAGFTELSNEVGRMGTHVSHGLSELNASFRWGFNEMLASLGGMQDSLKQLCHMVELEHQTKAYAQYKDALDAFHQQLYTECLEALDKAINGDHTQPGYKLEWRFHRLKGLVYLGSEQNTDASVVDPAKAEEALLLSARYARARAPQEAAKSLLAAGWAAYVQAHDRPGKLADALKHTEEALKLDTSLTEAMFQAAKVHMSLGAPEAGLPVLRRAIEKDRGYLLKAADDGAFQQHHGKVAAFVSALREEKIAGLKRRVLAKLDEVREWTAKSPDVDWHRQEAVITWRSVMQGGPEWGLLDLMQYEQDRFDEDVFNLECLAKEATLAFVEINLGRYWIGSPDNEPGRVFYHETRRAVELTRSFKLQDTPVTKGQWSALMGSNPSIHRAAGLPVDHISWFNAVGFCNALSRAMGFEEAYALTGVRGTLGRDDYSGTVTWKRDANGYRLPTSAEWEVACRAGTDAPQYGNLDDVAWYRDNSGWSSHPVRQKAPNAWGLYDMLGNVREWCWDWDGDGASSTDPSGPETGSLSLKVTRGGCSTDDATHVRASAVGLMPPGYGGASFRPARSLK